MKASFVIKTNSDEAVDNGIAQLNVLLKAGRAPGFAVFVNTFPRFGGGPPAHLHNTYDEAFYVVTGEMEFCVDGDTARGYLPDRWHSCLVAPRMPFAIRPRNRHACWS